jgi:hypothetical protein
VVYSFVMSRLGNITLCFYSKQPYDTCNCDECMKDFKLHEQMKANGYTLDASDNGEKL